MLDVPPFKGGVRVPLGRVIMVRFGEDEAQEVIELAAKLDVPTSRLVRAIVRTVMQQARRDGKLKLSLGEVEIEV